MKKRVRQLASLVMAATMVLSNMIPTFAAPATFTDTGGHWAQEQIQKTSEKGFMGGYPDGTFLPNEEVSYGMTFTVLDRVFSQFNERYAKALSPEEIADFGQFIDYLHDFIVYLQREDKDLASNAPEEMMPLAEAWLQALDQDVKKLDSLKETYGFTMNKDFAEKEKESYLNELSSYTFYEDNFDEWYRLLTEHKAKLEKELDRETYLYQIDETRSSDPGISFLMNIPRISDSIDDHYEVIMFWKTDYILQTGDLSPEEKKEWKKLCIEFNYHSQEFSFVELEPVQSDKHYAYNHYLNMLYATTRQSTYFPSGWQDDFKNMDFEQTISRDALFGLINHLLLGSSSEYKDHYLYSEPNPADNYTATDYLDPQEIEALIGAKLLDGSGSGIGNAKLNLDQPLTRAQLSTMANRVYEYLENLQ